MSLITLRQINLAFGGRPLLDGVNLQLEAGERVCLLGRNGEGKSTLLRLINQEVEPDSGELIFSKGLRCARLEQEIDPALDGTVYQVAAGAPGSTTDPLHLEKVLSRLELPAEQPFSQLSGGLKRRVLLARALACDPELLMLDEPTNHLDISAINRLEESLLAFNGALLFITHDRQLVRHLATRIIELDRGHLTSWPGDYDNYLRRRDEMLSAEANLNNKFDRKLAEEESWIRRGIKARRTRNQGRVEALLEMRRLRAQRREQSGRVKMELKGGIRSGRSVIKARDISFNYDDKGVIKGLNTTILRGDKVGIIGPNGVGKSTLLRLLLGQIPPSSGELTLGTNLDICYFDQHREQLNPEASVAENLADGRDTVVINGRSRHVLGYLKDFLFAPDRARSPVGILSGGEKNRLLLARLFTRPCNVLVMDEPTNDLDVETLELLEELLLNFSGTLLLVSHDRSFLNNVVTSTLVFEDQGRVVEYAGGYDDWLRQRAVPSGEERARGGEDKRSASAKGSAKAPGKQKGNGDSNGLSFTEIHELKKLPARLEELEKEQGRLLGQMSEPKFYQRPAAETKALQERLSELEQKLAEGYKRWEELEEHA